jgi:acetylornithine deacetylase/succinyl-diaminopimelate desuccinylase-like protein
MVAVAAHLDTVFPEGTDVRVRRQGTRLSAPGIGDNTRGLALMLTVIRAMGAAGITTDADILFVGNVGEEGEGDLRGVRYLLREGKYKERITSFLAIDGGDQENVTRGGVGSKRYRVVFTGPGGHSYGAFGLVNPAYAMAAAIAKFSDIQVPASPRTTFNVGVVQGGTSVNSIPSQVSMDVDMRSESCTELSRIDEAFGRIVRGAVEDENRARSTVEGRIAARMDVIGQRPCGETPLSSAITRKAAAVLRAFGLTPRFGFSSTDSNIPMSLGMPALTIGRGGPGGRSHAPDEWTDVAPDAAARAAEIALALVTLIADAP